MIPTEMSHPAYHDENEARKFLEAIRWPNGPSCPYCGQFESVAVLGGKSMGPGWYHCTDCRRKFTVRVRSVFERSHILLHTWLLGFRAYASSKKGFNAHQLHRTLGITYRSAWFMAHRIREAMRDDGQDPLGGKGKVVEADEAFIGPAKDVYVNDRGWMKERGTGSKHKVISLVERSGKSRAIKAEDLSARTIRKTLFENIVLDSRLHSDEAHRYCKPGEEFATHERVNHSAGQYARGDVTTNTVEGFVSIFERGMTGIYQYCGEQHLQRYLDEFGFRYSNRAALGVNDAERTTRAITGGRQAAHLPTASWPQDRLSGTA
jgi:transposase-like protein